MKNNYNQRNTQVISYTPISGEEEVVVGDKEVEFINQKQSFLLTQRNLSPHEKNAVKKF